MKRSHVLVLLMVAGSALAAGLPRSTAPADAQVYIIAPRNGATVTSPVTVQFGLKGMGIAPAGVAMAGTGHHHLLIDVEVPALDQPADHLHLPHEPPIVSEPITVTVR